MPIRIIATLAYILFSWLALTMSAALADDRVEIPITISTLPNNVWAKDRIVANYEGDAVVLRDFGRGPFNDASMWKIPIDQKLPFGRKILSFDLNIGKNHKPLWGDKLFHPIINGVKAEPATNAQSVAAFEAIYENDGKGFLPVKSQTILLQMNASDLALSTFAFETAGAEGFEIKISNMKVIMLSEKDEQSFSVRAHVSTLGYREDGPKTIYIEWPDNEERLSQKEGTISLESKTNGLVENINARIPTQRAAISGSRVSQVDLGNLAAGQYELVVPSFGNSKESKKVPFEVKAGNKQFEMLRDDAWSSFYWITNGPHGPYPKAHQQDLGAIDYDVPTETKDVTGGWFDAGDYGKYSVNGAYSVSLMLLTGLIAPEVLSHDIDTVANAPADARDWLRVADNELRWLYKMQREDGAVYHKATSRKWPSLSIAPEDDRAIKWLMPVTTTATANFAGAMSLAAKIYLAQNDEIYRRRGIEFQTAAERALNWLNKNPEIKKTEFSYEGDEYGGPYHDDDDNDERFFALASYATLTGNKAAMSAARAKLNDIKGKMKARAYDVNWRTVDLLGVWALATSDKLDNKTKKSTFGILRSAANGWRDIQEQSSWNISIADDSDLFWGSNSRLATIGWHWGLWSHLSGDDSYVKNAEMQLHYFFGNNPLDKTYITGTLPNSVKAPHFRPSTSGRIDLPAGFMAGGPNSSSFPEAPPMHSYVDDIESASTNEFAINWQSAWTLYTSLLAAQVQ